ncbi:helix-turn-helix domain-containing protein [Paenibacillus glycanilyticus]|uniref:HTH araC/xylS-type domain-containing protein n=1 Tax=Paenibacillus glycanilyticus TaxID=126569 RepID=A0ABQ6G8L0_9BACL|nr:AraC family transcriptional regulator [Paenibacillus glycanilyticus]GLX66605.1 hypothetical protein MU1_09490 [Paenibacillus glycanilyticus]
MKNSFYKNIFISFLLVILLYTVIIAITVGKNAYDQQKLNLESNVKFSLEKKTHEIDNQLLAANNAIRLAADQSSVKSLATSNTEEYTDYANIYNDLIVNPYFLNFNSQYTIALTKGFGSKVISTNGYFDFYDYLDFIHLGSEIEDINQFFANSAKDEVTVIQSDKRVALIRYMNVKNGASPVTFFVSWDKASLVEDSIYGDAGAFSIVDATILQKQLPDKGLWNEILASNIEDSKQSITSFTQNDVTHYVAESSVVPDVYYDYSINLQKVLTFPTKIILSLVGYFILLISIGSFLLVVLSKRNYRPYEQILNEVQRFGGDSNAENTETVLNKIQDLIKVNQGLIKSQEDVSEEVKELFLKNILFDNYSKKEISKLTETLDLNDVVESGIIAIFTFDGIADREENMNISEKLIYRKSFLQKCFKSHKLKESCLILDLNVNRYALILPVDMQLINLLDSFVKKTSTDLKINASYAISVPFHSIKEISRVFADVYYSSNNAEADDKWVTLTEQYEDVQFKVEIEQMLISHISKSNFKEAKQILHDLLDNHILKKQITLYLINDLKFILFHTLRRAIQNSGLSYHQFVDNNRSEILNLQKETDPIKVRDKLIALYDRLFEYVATEKMADKSLTERIVEYIDHNYTRELSLGEVAAHFNLSESYLSKIIKDYLGVSYKNYLNQIRINEAIRLLKTNNYKVTEVAEKLGYTNVNTFIRVFKQIEGTTPGKYLQNAMD